jgi:ABC-type branched-subunit amino acid transport system ATPase component
MTAIAPATTKPQTASHPAKQSARPVVLSARYLRKAFGGHAVLEDVSFDLRQGEVVLLRGENGSGKTTLLHLLTGHLEPDGGQISLFPSAAEATPARTGATLLTPSSHWSWPASAASRLQALLTGRSRPTSSFASHSLARQGIGRTWQDVRLFSSQTLQDNIAVASARHRGEQPWQVLFRPNAVRHDEAAITAQAQHMLQSFGLGDRLESSADMISLGQSKRVAIARAVAAGARILFLDEPLAGLDRQGIAEITGFLQTLVEEKGVTLVIVEHVFNFVHLDHLVTTTWGLSGGTLEIDEMYPTPSVSSIGGIPVVTHPLWFNLLSARTESVVTEPLPHGATLTRFRLPGRFRAEPLLFLSGLQVQRGPRWVIGGPDAASASSSSAGFSFTLHQGEIAVLQAPNGWGKSTLFEAIAGLLPSRGTVRLGGTDLTALPPWERAQAGLQLTAAGTSYFQHLSLGDLASLTGAALPADLPPPYRLMSSLSGGQRRRAASAAFLARPQARVGLMDEPFLALDAARIEEFIAQLFASPYQSLLIAEPLRHTSPVISHS